MRAMIAGGFTDELLAKFYQDDPEGLAEHYRLVAE